MQILRFFSSVRSESTPARPYALSEATMDTYVHPKCNNKSARACAWYVSEGIVLKNEG